jgi:hypothetical protein
MTEVIAASQTAAPALNPKAVLIACPDTFDLVPTGVHVADFAELSGEYTLAACASCGAQHRWQPFAAVPAP